MRAVIMSAVLGVASLGLSATEAKAGQPFCGPRVAIGFNSGYCAPNYLPSIGCYPTPCFPRVSCYPTPCFPSVCAPRPVTPCYPNIYSNAGYPSPYSLYNQGANFGFNARFRR